MLYGSYRRAVKPHSLCPLSSHFRGSFYCPVYYPRKPIISAAQQESFPSSSLSSDSKIRIVRAVDHRPPRITHRSTRTLAYSLTGTKRGGRRPTCTTRTNGTSSKYTGASLEEIKSIMGANLDLALAIIPKVGASLSIPSSMFIIWEAVSDHRRGKGTAIQRALVGMSSMDVAASFAWFLSTWAVPEGTAPLSRGNTASCNFQGFLLQLAIGVSISQIQIKCSSCFCHVDSGRT